MDEPTGPNEQGRVPSGLDSLLGLRQALEALLHQIMNLDPRKQGIEVYGVMVPRWAAAPGTSMEAFRGLQKEIWTRRSAQDVRILDAHRVVQALIREHSLSQDLPPTEAGG